MHHHEHPVLTFDPQDSVDRNACVTYELTNLTLSCRRNSFFCLQVPHAPGEGGLQQLLSDGLSSLDQPGPPTINLNQAGLVGLTPERVLMNKCIVQGGSGIVNMDPECASKLLLDIQKWNCGLNKADVGKGKKRKLSDMSDLADSTNCPDTEPTTSTGQVSTTTGGAPGGKADSAEKSALTQSNQLLAQLLAEKTTKEHPHSVNTLHTLTPVTAIPQSRLPKDLTSKLMRENNNNNPGTQNKQESPSAAVGIPTTPRNTSNLKENQRPTVWDNPKTSPNSPYPGNTKDSPLLSGGIPQQGAQGMAVGTTGNVASSTHMASSFAPAISAANGSGVMSSTGGANVSSSSDLLAGDEDLSQILQQATELQNDLSSGQLYEQPTAVEHINLSNVLEVVSFL